MQTALLKYDTCALTGRRAIAQHRGSTALAATVILTEAMMAREWLNVFVDQAGNSPASQWVDAKDTVQLGNKAIRIFESDRSGAVVMTNGGIASYGDSEVYLKINFSSGTFRYLSAPLHYPVEVLGVASLELHILFLVGPAGTPYRALVNAHCVYEVL